MDTYGIFSDEGLLEGEFSSREKATVALALSYDGADAHVGLVCHDHPDHEKDSCEECEEDSE